MPANRPDHKTPRLPPGFGSHEAADPWNVALAAVADGAPGTVFHAPLGGMLDAAVLLAPDRPITDAVILRMAVLALTGAIVAAVPPESVVEPIAFDGADWTRPGRLSPGPTPDGVALNGGAVAQARVARAEATATGEPEWVVLGLSVRVALRLDRPGDAPGNTDLAEEGADVSASDLLESLCRHLLAAFDVWQADGAAGVDRAWEGIAAAMQPA